MLCLLLLLAGCRPQGALLDQAQAAWDSSDYPTAAARYEEFLKDNPHHAQAELAHFQVGNIYYLNLRQYDRAVQHYIHLIEDFPHSPHLTQARQRLAESYVAMGKPREAIKEYETLSTSLSGTPEWRRVRLSIADLYYDLNDLSQALAEYQKVTKALDGAPPYDELVERADLRIGGIRYLRDEFEEAIPVYQTVAERSRDANIRRQARLGLADCYVRTFQYDDAVKVLEQIERDPKAPEAIPRRIAAIREQQRQHNFSQPGGEWQAPKKQ